MIKRGQFRVAKSIEARLEQSRAIPEGWQEISRGVKRGRPPRRTERHPRNRNRPNQRRIPEGCEEGHPEHSAGWHQ